MTFIPVIVSLLSVILGYGDCSRNAWRFDGNEWERVKISGAYPSQRILNAMTFDEGQRTFSENDEAAFN